MAVLLGINARLYYTTSQTPDDPLVAASAMTEVTNATDLTLDLSLAEADISVRGTSGFRAKVGTLAEGTIDFDMIWDDADTVFDDFITAWNNRSVLTIAALDKAKAIGAQGLYAPMAVIGFSKSEALEDAQKVSVSLAVTKATFLAPSWTKIAA